MHPVFVHIFDKRRLFANRWKGFFASDEGFLGLGFFVFDSIDEIEFNYGNYGWWVNTCTNAVDGRYVN